MNSSTLQPWTSTITPVDTNTAVIKTVDSTRLVYVQGIFITNTGGSAATYRLHVNQSAATGATTNAIAYDAAIAANTTVFINMQFSPGLPLLKPGATLLGRSSSANNITFLAYGEERV